MSVYFAQRENLIKIGWSINVRSRVTTLKAKLIGAIPGDKKKETELHKRFASLRVRGEWFKANKNLLTYIRNEAQKHKPDRTYAQVPIRIQYELLERIDTLAKNMSHPFVRITRSEMVRFLLTQAVDRAEKKKR